MILDKDKDALPDAPPSYQTALQGGSAAVPVPAGFTSPSNKRPPFPAASTSSLRSTASSSSVRRPAKSRQKSSPRWLPTSIFGLSKTAKQVRSTTQSLLRDLLTQQTPSTEAQCTAVLASCAEACEANSLSLANILQDPFIEGHLPVYWAILKRPATPKKTDHTSRPHAELEAEADALTMAILAASLPLTAASIAETRHACLIASNHGLFMRIRTRFKAFSPLSGPDAMLLGSNGVNTDLVDAVDVEELRGDVGAFVARFDIVLFQLRMRVSKSVKVEFIARGRLWYLMFSAADASNSAHRAGAWLVTLGLADHSPPTWVDAKLIIEDKSTTYEPPRASHSPGSSLAHRMGVPPRHPATSKDKPLPSVTLPLKSGSREVAPAQPNPGHHHAIVVPLEKSMMGGNIQLEGTSYVDSSGTLSARVEVRLMKSESDTGCIIC
ncbi:hypothetical protein FA95DRAFT_1025406 [Auriscalpium vulgare]|uniref:Uncharacterized protein n=1 Tax=Auriscalpium vulgare TaxID=40419 RepID=A0ACB8RWI3_9AGAM|nr:hypothetical protein FA95DRAFT_1025406 [Auriscalpium vulgare]